jgi:NifU-like protein involved in Fe-S cluster formation
VYLKAAERRVVRASFEAEGCGVTVAAASLLTELIIGRTLAECRTISAETLQDALGGLPPHKHYCAWVVVEALHQALPPDTYFAG